MSNFLTEVFILILCLFWRQTESFKNSARGQKDKQNKFVRATRQLHSIFHLHLGKLREFWKSLKLERVQKVGGGKKCIWETVFPPPKVRHFGFTFSDSIRFSTLTREKEGGGDLASCFTYRNWQLILAPPLFLPAGFFVAFLLCVFSFDFSPAAKSRLKPENPSLPSTTIAKVFL